MRSVSFRSETFAAVGTHHDGQTRGCDKLKTVKGVDEKYGRRQIFRSLRRVEVCARRKDDGSEGSDKEKKGKKQINKCQSRLKTASLACVTD